MTGLVIGCGYLGKRVVTGWREEGWSVFAITRHLERYDELRALGAEPVRADVLDPASWRQVPFEKIDSIVCAVGMDQTPGVPRRTVYVDGLRTVLAELASRSVRPRLVYVSSTGVYGQSQGEEVDESAVTEPVDEPGQVVLEAERVLLEHRPDAIRLRFAGIYGPGRLIRSQALLAGTPLTGNPDGWLNLIHVEDGARAVLAACDRGVPGLLCNVSDDRPVRRVEFYTRMAELLGAPAPRWLPPVSGQPLPPHERANRRIVNLRLRRELGVVLRCPTFEEGLAASIGRG